MIAQPPYRFPYTPNDVSSFSLTPNQRSGRNTSASGPHTSRFLRNELGRKRRSWTATYILYPSGEIKIGVPAGMGNSLYALPDAPITGFERGMMSSLVGDRTISIAMGCSLRVSLVSATKQGMVSKSFAVKSVSPLALTFCNVSLISVRNRDWNWRFFASSQRANVN